MQESFGFYISICNQFFKNLGSEVESKTLDQFLQKKIRPKLFETEYCDGISELKKKFLTEIIKVEQYIQGSNYNTAYLNDLEALKKVADAIYELLEKHWELYRYQDSKVDSQTLISFILEIDRIGIGWDAYLEKYIVISTLLKSADTTTIKAGQSLLTIKYHLPEGTPFTLEMANSFNSFLKFVFEFVLKVHNYEEGAYQLSLHSQEVRTPITCTLVIPENLRESYHKLLSYLSMDVLKRETLVKYAMEVVRLQQLKPLPKTSITSYHKNISKFLKALHPQGYVTVDSNEKANSVEMLANLCVEMDDLDIRYNDLLIGASESMARDKTDDKAEGARSLDQDKPTLPQVKSKNPATLESVVVKKPAGVVKTKPPSSTVKIDIKEKEHINFLTS